MRRFLSLSYFLLLFIACNEKKSSYNQPYNSSSKSYSKQKEQKKDSQFTEGEEIFDKECTACHRMDRKLVGPPLQNITKQFDKKRLFSFIVDNQELIEKGDSAAVKIWLEYNKSPMPNFKHLTQEELEKLYYYLDYYE